MVVIVYAVDRHYREQEWGRIFDGEITTSTSDAPAGLEAFETYLDLVQDRHDDLSLTDPHSLVATLNGPHIAAAYYDATTDRLITDPADPVFDAPPEDLWDADAKTATPEPVSGDRYVFF